MRRSLVAGAVVVLIGGSATYAVVDRLTEKVETTATIVETPRVETARLFAPAHNVSPTPARDLIAAKLESQPVIWPDVPKSVVKQKAAEPTVTARKKQAQKPKRKKPKPVMVTSTLTAGGVPNVRLD